MKTYKYSITWTAIYEGFWFTEVVTQKELDQRLTDNTIKITAIHAFDPDEPEN